MSNKEVLDRYKFFLEQKLGWGNSSSWSNQEFENLSDKIYGSTKIKLSVSTLKRITGKIKYEGAFNKATLNALALYIGFENWNSFEYSGFQQDSPIVINSPTATREKVLETPKSTLKSKVVFALIIAGLVFVLIGYKISINKISQAASSVKFSSRKVTNDLPNSVVFNYDVSKVDADSFFIQQNWDPQRRQKIAPQNHTHTSIYYYPGNFNARLIANDQVLQKSRVFIQTRGWKGIIEQDPVPIYLSDEEIDKAGALGISKETLKEKTGLNVYNGVNTLFLNIRSLNGLKADNFHFETTLKNTSTVNMSLCRLVYIYILFNGGTFTIPLADKGCISSLYLSTGEKVLDGEHNNLSNFGCDFKKYQTLGCLVQNKVLTILLNGKPIFKDTVAENKEELVGIKIAFEGTGEIRRVKLGTPLGVPVINEVFR